MCIYGHITKHDMTSKLSIVQTGITQSLFSFGFSESIVIGKSVLHPGSHKGTTNENPWNNNMALFNPFDWLFTVTCSAIFSNMCVLVSIIKNLDAVFRRGLMLCWGVTNQKIGYILRISPGEWVWDIQWWHFPGVWWHGTIHDVVFFNKELD